MFHFLNIIEKRPYLPEKYTLTPLGQSLSPVTEFLSQWGIRYLKDNGIDYIKDQHLYK